MAVVTVVSGYPADQSYVAQWATRPLIVLDDNTAIFLFAVREDNTPGPAPTAVAGVYVAKTTNRGTDWSVPFTTVVALAAEERIEGMGVWYDKWTPGQVGTKVHVVYTKTFAPQGGFYRRVESTTGLPEESAQQVNTITGGSVMQHYPVKCINGHLYNISRLGSGSQAVTLARSTNNGSTWTQNLYNSPTALPDGLAAVSTQWWAIVPSPTIPGGFWLFVQPISGSIHHYEWNGTSFNAAALIDSGLISTASYPGLSATIRHSDGAVFLAYHTNAGGTPNVVRVTRVTALGTWQIRGTVATASGPTDQLASPQITCVQETGELIVGWVQGVLDGTVFARRKRSQSSGLLWSAPVLLNPDSIAGVRLMFAPLSTPGPASAFYDVIWWFVGGPGYFSGLQAPFLMGGYRVRNTEDGGPGQVGSVSCETGQLSASMGQEDSPRLIPDRFPNVDFDEERITDAGGQVNWFNYGSPTGSFQAGDLVQGATSGATGYITGFLATGRVGIANITAGPGPGPGVPFLPNEEIVNQARVGRLAIAERAAAVTSPNVELSEGPPVAEI